MGWYLVRVHDLDGGEEGCAIFCSVTASFVRPMVDHPQSVFDEKVAQRIAAYLVDTYGDPRKGEHTIDPETLRALSAGIEGTP